MVYYFPRCPVPIAAWSLMAALSLTAAPFPLCQAGYSLVSAITIWPPGFPNSRPFPLCQPVFRLVSAITPR